MELIATKNHEWKNNEGLVCYKTWLLKDAKTSRIYGDMVYNKNVADNKCFVINICNHVHYELVCRTWKTFASRTEALAWAREQIESLPKPTREECEEMLVKINTWRYEDLQYDNFAYTNGKIDRWDRIEREIRKLMEKL